MSNKVADLVTEGTDEGAELAAAAAEAAAEGAAAAGEVAADLADAAAPAAAAAAEAAAEGAATAGEAAAAAGDAAAEAASAAAGAAKDFYNNPETQAILGEGFGHLDEAYSMSVTGAKQGMMIASGLATAGCAALVPLLRVEIFRDFSQIMGVVFGSAYAEASGFMYATVSAFGGAFNVMTLDLGKAFQTADTALIGFVIAIGLGLFSVMLYIWLVCFSGVANMAEDSVRLGHEAVDFVEHAKSKKKTVFLATQTITLSVSAYLPVCQVVAQVLFCDPASYIIKSNGGNCSNDMYTLYTGVAVVLILAFIIPLPIFLYTMIERFKPKGSPKNPEIVFDQDGEEVPFDDKVYNELVEHDINQQMVPFLSLYKGFEKDWSQWKVILMVYKVIFVLPTIILATYVGTTGVAFFQLILIVLNFFAVTAIAPFIDPLNDTMDFNARLTAIVVALGGIVTTVAGDSAAASSIMGVIVLAANSVNGVSMVLLMLAGVPSVNRCWKNCRGSFTWSDTSRNLEGLSAKNVIGMYNVKKEIKHRVWQTWWNGVLLNKCGDDVPGRLVKLQKDTVDNGLATIKNHWVGEKDDIIRQNRKDARTKYEGVDLYWDDASGTRDGHLDSETFFGKMYVTAYPFHLVIVYDDADDETFIEDSDVLGKFIEKQNSPEIVSKVERRRKFRALSAQGCQLHFQFTREEIDRNVPDGTHQESYQDSEGKSHTRTVQDYSDIPIMITYTMGVVHVASNYPDKKFATGFKATMTYEDGHGHAIKPRTKEPYNVSNRHCEMPQEHMGINKTWEETDTMTKLFNVDGAQNAFDNQMPVFEQSLVEYRNTLLEKEAMANAVLGDGFWYYVYNDPYLPRTALQDYLAGEANPVLQALPDAEASGLDYLFKRMALVTANDKAALWFVFWEDFWLNNKEMSVVADLGEYFDPVNATALCYHYMERQELERFFNQNDMTMMRSTPEDAIMSKYCNICVKQYLSPSDLDWFYMRLNGEELPESDEARRKRIAGSWSGLGKGEAVPTEEPTE